jgi:hypothetical protein
MNEVDFLRYLHETENFIESNYSAAREMSNGVPGPWVHRLRIELYDNFLTIVTLKFEGPDKDRIFLLAAKAVEMVINEPI